MSRDLPQILIDNLEAGVVYPFYSVELLFDNSQTLRMWTGVGVLELGGNEYYGTGALLQVSAIEETSEIAARGATLSLSGVPQEVISLALTEPYQGRICNISFGQLKLPGYLQKEDLSGYITQQDGSRIEIGVVNGLAEIFTGYMDTMEINDDGANSTIELQVENKLVDLERQRVARYTSAYQKSIYPNDKGFDFVESLQDQEIFWGRGSN